MNAIKDMTIDKFNYSKMDDISAIVINVNLEKADLEYASLFRDYIIDKLNSECQNFIIDFTYTSYLDTTFLGSIILIYRKIIENSKSLKVVIDSSKLSLLSVVSNFGKYLKVFPSLDDAVESCVASQQNKQAIIF
jgi:anti-anti-sigma regulatory factor